VSTDFSFSRVLHCYTFNGLGDQSSMALSPEHRTIAIVKYGQRWFHDLNE